MRRVDVVGDEMRAETTRAPAARLRVLLVELEEQELHEAGVGGEELAHARLLVAPLTGHRRDAVGRVLPRLRRAPPLPAVGLDRTFDLEDLQRREQARAPQVHVRFELGELHPLVVAEELHHLVDVLARRERGVDEPVLDARVFVAGEPDRVGAVDGPAGAADLLVERDRGSGDLEVHDEREVGLVVAHAERRGRDDALELVGQQLRLDLDAVLGGLVAGVRARGDATGPQPRRRRGARPRSSTCRRCRCPAAPAAVARATPTARPAGAGRTGRARGSPDRANRAARADRHRVGRRRRGRPDRSRSPSCTAPACRPGAGRARVRCAGSRGGSRGPSH